MTSNSVFCGYPVFAVGSRGLEEIDRALAAKELEAVLESWEGKVQTRGVYSTTGFGSTADLMLWWVASSPDDLQNITIDFRRTTLGRALVPVESFLGVVRPAEFTKDHQPAFVQGKEPKRYACLYPFVRTPEWYLLDPEERGALLREHGEAGREFPDVLANTTSAFGLGDYEWILAFEADAPDRIVDLIRRLRATRARLYTKVEIPFYTGIRKGVSDAVRDLP